MQRYVDIFVAELGSYARYLVHELTHPGERSYFYGLILVSLAVYGLELVRPWRRQQPRVRRDFWIDGFYLFFNFFLFSLLGYHAIASVVAELVRDGLGAAGIRLEGAIDVTAIPADQRVVRIDDEQLFFTNIFLKNDIATIIETVSALL